MQGLFVSGGQNGCVSVVVEIVSDTRLMGHRFFCVYYLFLNMLGGLMRTLYFFLFFGLVWKLGTMSFFFFCIIMPGCSMGELYLFSLKGGFLL